MKNNALSCPFCESDEIAKVEKFTGNYRYGKPVYIVFVRCQLCEACTKSFPYIVSDAKEAQQAEEFALDAWNRRGKLRNKTTTARWEVERDGYRHYAMCTSCKKEVPYFGTAIPVCPNCESIMDSDIVFYEEEHL